jgi:hypothetical protein
MYGARYHLELMRTASRSLGTDPLVGLTMQSPSRRHPQNQSLDLNNPCVMMFYVGESSAAQKRGVFIYDILWPFWRPVLGCFSQDAVRPKASDAILAENESFCALLDVVWDPRDEIKQEMPIVPKPFATDAICEILVSKVLSSLAVPGLHRYGPKSHGWVHEFLKTCCKEQLA